MLVRTLQADLRGVMRLWRCAPAPYRVCANIVGKHLVFPQGRPLVARAPTKTNFRRGGVSPPACRNFYPTSRRRTPEPALCKGRCRAPRGGGVAPDRNYLFSCSAISTLLQSLRRSRAGSLYRGVPFGLCEHCKLTCGASWAPPPTGFVRTLWGSALSSVGGHSICPRCLELNLNTRRRTPEPALCKGRCRAKRGGGGFFCAQIESNKYIVIVEK